MSGRVLQQTDFPQSSPAPTPSRANYGFALYLASNTAFALYCAWALNLSSNGKPLLHTIGLTYLPQVYWAVAIPIHLITTMVWVALILYPSINRLTNKSIDNPSVIKDSSTIPVPNENRPRTCVPPLYDLNPADVTKRLYLEDS